MGIQDVQGLWHTGEHAVRTPYGTVLPPGGRVAAYLRSTGLANYDPPEIAENLHTTLRAALKTCRSGARDTIMVLPGHAEDVTDGTMLADLKEGTRIVGAGFHPYEFGNTSGHFRWTAAAANWAVAVRGVIFQNLFFNFGDDSAAPVNEAITITNLGNAFVGCRYLLAQDATQRCVVGIGIRTQAHRTRIAGCAFLGTPNVTAISAAILLPDVVTDPAEVEITDNLFNVSGTHIGVEGPATGLYIARNRMFNSLSTSDFCMVFTGASSGMVSDNHMAVMGNGTASARGISVGSTTCRFFENYCSDESGRSGVLSPVVVAT